MDKRKIHPILNKIDEGTVTTDDFNKLISEATPEAVRDRVRRRVKRSETDKHIDDEGHQKLENPSFTKRVQPKREKPDRSQMHGQGKVAHRKSARTQKRTMKKSFDEGKKFSLIFDKAGYVRSLKDLLEGKGYKEGKDYVFNSHILTVVPGVKFDEELKEFMVNVGKAKRVDTTIPDMFEYGDK